MQLVNFGTVAIEGLKVLEEPRKEGQRSSVSSTGHQKVPVATSCGSRDIQPAQANHVPTNFDN